MSTKTTVAVTTKKPQGKKGKQNKPGNKKGKQGSSNAPAAPSSNFRGPTRAKRYLPNAGVPKRDRPQYQADQDKTRQAMIRARRAPYRAITKNMNSTPYASELLQKLFAKITLAGLDANQDRTPIVPNFTNLGDERFYETIHHSTVMFDFVPATALFGSLDGPSFGLAGYSQRPIYDTGDFPIIFFHDALVSAVMPVVPTADRDWRWPGFAFAGGLDLADSALYTEGVEIGLFVQSGGMPAILNYRAPTVRVSSSEQYTYVWIDASENKLASWDTTFHYNFHPGLQGDVLEATIQMYRFIGKPTDVYVHEYSFTNLSGQGSASFPNALAIKESGYYRFEVSMQASNGLGGAGIGKLEYANFEFKVVETTTLATGFLVNLFHQQANPSARKYFLAGSGALLSPRFPLLTTQGSILGAQLDPWYTVWYTAAQDGAGAVNARPVDKIFGAEAGAKLSDGCWVYGSPAIYPDLQDLNLVDLTNQGNGMQGSWPGQGNFRPVSYLLPSDGPGANVVGMKMVLLSSNSDSAKVPMRLTCTKVIDYSAETQAILGERPPFFPPDEWAALLSVLRRMPPMTTNDWHSFFAKVSRTAGQVALFLARVVDGVGSVVPVIRKSAELAAEISVLAAL